MKNRILSLLLIAALGFAPVALSTGCKTAPGDRVAQTQTLKAVGHTAEAAVSSSAQLYAAGQITADQARQVIEFFNNRFQPVYRLAVNANNANLDLQAPEQLIALAAQLSALILQFTTPTHTTNPNTP